MVFTAQVKALSDLYGVQGIPDILIDTLQQAFGNCAQQLTHNGPATFTAGIGGTGQWVRAQSNWTNLSGNGSYVMCKRVTDRTGTSYVVPKTGTIPTIKVYLPRVGMGDPNVRTGDVFVAGLDDNQEYVGISHYMDMAIGMGAPYFGDIANLRGGWRLVTGSEGRVPVGIGGTLGLSSPYDTTGSTTHNHTGSTGSASVTVDSASATIDPADVPIEISSMPPRSVTISGMVPYGGGFVNTTPADIYLSGASTYTDYAVTGVSVDNHAVGVTGDTQPSAVGSGTTSTEVTGISVASHSGQTTGSGGAGSGTASGSTGSATTGITVANHANHTHSVSSSGPTNVSLGAGAQSVINSVGSSTGNETPTLTHSVTDPGHTHSFSGVSVTISAHTHTIPTLSHSVTDTGHFHSISGLTVTVESHHHSTPLLTHTVNDPTHRHVIDLSAVFGDTSHIHEVPIAAIAAGMGITPGFGTVPGWTPEVTSSSHTHTMSGLTITASAHTHTISSASSVQPSIACYWIERYE